MVKKRINARGLRIGGGILRGVRTGKSLLCRILQAILPISCVVLLAGCPGKPPAELGVADGRLADCPARPNCVSTMAADTSRRVEPLVYHGDRKAAMAALAGIIDHMSGGEIADRGPGYLRAEFSSKVFGFVDDVEFYMAEGENIIHIRSASRIGYYDFGVNEKRISRIKTLWREQVDNKIEGSLEDP